MNAQVLLPEIDESKSSTARVTAAARKPVTEPVTSKAARPTPQPQRHTMPTVADHEVFDWQDGEAVFVQEQPRSAVYRNPMDQIVIRQERSWDQDEDTYVRFNEQAVPDLIRKLAKQLGLEDVIEDALWKNGK